jgi:hypothetical protein
MLYRRNRARLGAPQHHRDIGRVCSAVHEGEAVYPGSEAVDDKASDAPSFPMQRRDRPPFVFSDNLCTGV